MEKKKRLPAAAAVLIAGFAVCIIMYAAAALSSSFADFYTDHIFIPLSMPFGFLTSLLPFSSGELLIILGIAVVIVGIPADIFFLVKFHKNKVKQKKLSAFSLYFLGYVLLYIMLTETLNCFIQYRCTGFSDKYWSDTPSSGYELSQLEELCVTLTDRAVKLSEEVPRDSEGNVYIPDDAYEKAGLYMRMLGEDYSRLSGWYTKPKEILCSRFMSKSNLQGIYFPFTMEANINKDMCPARKPDTMCHELAHTKGFIHEDEAGFIAYLACAYSGDPLFEYSGVLSAMTYSLNQYYKYADYDSYVKLVSKLTNRVRADNRFLTDEYRQSLEKEKLLKAETVATVSDKALNANLKVNGISDGIQSYSRIVNLLLEEQERNKKRSAADSK